LPRAKTHAVADKGIGSAASLKIRRRRVSTALLTSERSSDCDVYPQARLAGIDVHHCSISAVECI